jgi:cytochrome c-type biogenesis protein CcmH
MTRWFSWLLMAGVLVVSLFIGVTTDRPPRTPAARANALASEVRCPTCANLSAAESDAKAAKAVRDEIATRIARGESDAQIRGYLASRYEGILLRPEARGVAALVWILPVAAGIAALAGLVAAFRRWSSTGGASPTDDDRALVEEALRS